MIEELNTEFVDTVVEYQSTAADYSAILKDEYRTQKYRVYYLKNLREEWEWVDNSDDGVSFVLLKRRN